MVPDAVDMLVCPVCGAPLEEREAALSCAEGHNFDLARQGYANLLPGDASPPGTGDSAEMVAAREAFLAAGHFDAVASALAAGADLALASGPEGGVVDVGGGTGWYLARALDRLPGRSGLCLELSRYAARRAARAHARAGAVVCDVWAGLPVRDAVAALALSVFAPRNGPEIARVLAPGGSALVSSPTQRHIQELVEPLGLLSVDERKRGRVDAALAPLRRQGTCEVEYEMPLSAAEIELLVAMGPSARHAGREDVRDRIDALAAGPVTCSVELALFTA